MTVKTIFKALLGTIVVIVVSSFLIELFNISVTGMQIRQMTKMAARQACVLFTQETYKTGDGKGAVNLPNITASDGTEYVTGNFYGSTNPSAIWYRIYGLQDFVDFCGLSGRYANDTKLPRGFSSMYEAFPDLEILALSTGAIYDLDVENATVPDWSASDDSAAVKNYNKKIKAQAYSQNMFTTVNLGIPYMDDEIVSKMFRWNLTQILSNTLNTAIQKHEVTGDYFVNYKGFECYASQADIVKYQYRCYNLKNSTDRAEFSAVSNMLTGGGNLATDGYDRADNNIVTVVNIVYSIPISYRGITPIRSIFNYVWDHEVAGLDGEVDGTLEDRNWNTTTQNLELGGTGATGGAANGGNLSTLGELTYILVR